MEVRLNDISIEKFDKTLFDVLDHGHTHYTFPGGRGGTKSSFIGAVIPLLVTQHPGVHVAVFRKVANTMRDSVYSQIIAGIDTLGLSHLFRCIVSPMEITYLPTGQKILFRGMDKPEKIKSIKVPFGYIGITWFEELDQFHGRDEIRKVTQSTMRGGNKFWNFESFNPPITAANWANKDILIDRPDRLVTWSNYLDVPREWLGEQFLLEAEFLRETNERAYRHEYLGEAVGTGGMVFENVRADAIPQSLIDSFDNVLNGVDWGYYPDPWTFNRMQFDSASRTLYVFYEDETLKKSARETVGRVKAQIRDGDIVTCDNREENCSDYRAFGVSARGATKGPDSRKYSYEWLQSLNAIVIDPARCPKTLAEFLEYEYERDKNGDVISEYPDGNDHHIDAVRYATERIWRRRGR